MTERLGPVELFAGQPTMHAPEQQPLIDSDQGLFDSQKSNLHKMPTDSITGLPYPILPVEPPHLERSRWQNYHHHFYNRRDPDLEGNFVLDSEHTDSLNDLSLTLLAGFAVRMSRGQKLPYNLHEFAHQQYKLGPDLPRTIDAKFETVVKACSGVVSRWALDLSKPYEKRLVYMDDDVFKKVADYKVLCPEKYFQDRPAAHRRKILGNFLMRYAISRNIHEAVSEKVIDEFLHTNDEHKRFAQGNFILFQALYKTLDPLKAGYDELRKQGMVQPTRPTLRRAIRKYVSPDLPPQLHPILQQKLAA